MHEDPDSTISDPGGDPFPNMNQFAVSEVGLRKLLQKCSPWKASGPDMITARLLKECAKDLAQKFAPIFNKSLQTETSPED